ncbi:MAG: 50S ribosomal protein L19 [Patescibacteria group bacterium]
MQQAFKIGDVVKVTTHSGDEKKVHATTFEGMVIAARGKNSGRTFTVRKVASAGVAVERTFPLASPYIESIKVIKSTKVRRAKLYYLRNQ